MKSQRYTRGQNRGYGYNSYSSLEGDVVKAARKRPILFILIAIFLIVASLTYLYFNGYFDSLLKKEGISEVRGSVHFIDVGQGDSTAFFSEEGCIVVDAGPRSAAENTCGYVTARTDKIDYLVLTHADEDHIGGAITLLEEMEVENVIMNDASKSTAVFTDLLDALEDSEANIIKAEPETVYQVGEYTLEILGPITEFDGDHNEYSVTCRVSLADVSVLIMGDTGTSGERDYLERYGTKLKSDVLKLAHHGSSYSTCTAFFETVSPSFAVISCGADNSYGHPHKETIALLKSYSTPYYRTDEVGTVVFETDGENLVYSEPVS